MAVDSKVTAAFKNFDKDNSGSISRDELAEAGHLPAIAWKVNSHEGSG